MTDIFSSLNRSMRKDREAERADETRATDYMNTMKAVGSDELAKFKAPTLTSTQESELKGFSDTMGAETDSLMTEAGMKGSSIELESMKQWASDVEGMKHDMLEATKWESWARGLQSLGMSQDASRRIALMHTQDREEKIGIYSGLMGAIGGLLSKRSGRG